MSQRFTPRHADPTPPIRLLLLPDAADPDGTPRAALLLPDPRTGMRPVLRAFPTLAAALATKRMMEANP